MIRLFTSFYPAVDSHRLEEITHCLRVNCQGGVFDEICVFLERVECPPFQHGVMQTRQTQQRPVFNDFFDWARESDNSPVTLNVIANADIMFEKSFSVLLTALQPDQCMALSRWNQETGGGLTLYDRNDSQDVWAFLGPPKPVLADFPVGVPRCDNRILHELRQGGYRVINPAFSIRTIHVHSQHQGEYPVEGSAGFVEPPYAYLWPHNLWSWPSTLLHNFLHPETKVRWRFDHRRFKQMPLLRLVRKCMAWFRRQQALDKH